jgi:hypothetical protein
MSQGDQGADILGSCVVLISETSKRGNMAEQKASPKQLHEWRDKIPAHLHLRTGSRIVIIPWDDTVTGRLLQLLEEVTALKCENAGDLDGVLKESGAILMGTDHRGVEYELPPRPEK